MQSTGSHHGTDLTQLQREYRNMELNRKVYADETHQVMRRQQTVIENLRKDNEDMKAELSLADRHLKEGTLAQQQEEMDRLHDQLDTYYRKNVGETKRLETLTQQIRIMRHKVLHQKKHMGGVNAAKENQQLVLKQIRILENRLDKSLIKFNETLAQNKTLREEIDNLRRERGVFDTIYRKLEREHGEKKRQMAQAIESSNQAYEERDDAQRELQALQDESRADIEAHRRALLDLIEKLEDTKGGVASDAGKDRRSRSGGKGGLEEEKEAKQKLQKGTWGTATEKVQVQVSVERVHHFEEALLKIKAATQTDDLEHLVSAFIQKEDQNFSLFNYVNAQNDEIERLEDWIAGLRDKERRWSGNEEQATERQRDKSGGHHQQLLRDLETQVAQTELAAQKCERRCAEVQTTVNVIKQAIHSLFTKIECNTQVMVELVGDSMVTEANLMAYLGAIEERTTEILHQSNALAVLDASKNNIDNNVANQDALFASIEPASVAVGAAGGTKGAVVTLHSLLGAGPVAPMGLEPLQINPPNLDDYSSDDGDFDNAMHPLTRDELKVRTLKGMRRIHNAINSGHSNSKNIHSKRGATNVVFADSSNHRK